MFFPQLPKARPGQAKSHFAPFRPQVEALEGRHLPSTTAASVVVHPGDSIQKAVDTAAPGTLIYLQAGTYLQTVTVDKAGIKLIGLPGAHGAQVVIQNPGGKADGIFVTSNGGGFVLKNVVVSGFDQDGVLLTGVNDFKLVNVTARNDGDYGLFPVFCSHGMIEGCSASGSGDTGIYVGQSSNIEVGYNVVHDNLNGIEIENSTNVRVVGNFVHDNTVGILVDLLPKAVDGIQIVVSSHNTVEGNFVLNNNRPNSASPTDITATEGSGLGILLVGGDHTTVQFNVVYGNNTGGIVLLSGFDLLALAQLPAASYGTVDPNPSFTLIRYNVVFGNGSKPADPTLPHADLIASAAALQGSQNHWKFNWFQTSSPLQLP
jgi:parallel beta-helix repeat protein